MPRPARPRAQGSGSQGSRGLSRVAEARRHTRSSSRRRHRPRPRPRSHTATAARTCLVTGPGARRVLPRPAHLHARERTAPRPGMGWPRGARWRAPGPAARTRALPLHPALPLLSRPSSRPPENRLPLRPPRRRLGLPCRSARLRPGRATASPPAKVPPQRREYRRHPSAQSLPSRVPYSDPRRPGVPRARRSSRRAAAHRQPADRAARARPWVRGRSGPFDRPPPPDGPRARPLRGGMVLPAGVGGSFVRARRGPWRAAALQRRLPARRHRNVYRTARMA